MYLYISQKNSKCLHIFKEKIMLFVVALRGTNATANDLIYVIKKIITLIRQIINCHVRRLPQ